MQANRMLDSDLTGDARRQEEVLVELRIRPVVN